MRITRLVADDFFGFRHLDLNLTDVRGFVVVGKNGSGKSSVLDAYRWGLYGRFRDKGDRVIRRRQPEAKVRIEFRAQGRSWVIERRKPRDKTGTLHLWEATEMQGLGGATAHTTAETQARIDALVGLSYPGMLATALMVQTDQERNDLARMDPAKGMDLLTELFDMGDYPALHEAAKTRAATAQRLVVVADTRLGDLRGIVADEKDARAALERAQVALSQREGIRDEAQARIEAAKVAMATSRAAVEAGRAAAVREANLTRAIAQAHEDVARHRTAIERAVALREAAPPEAPVSVGVGEDLMAAARARLEEVHAAGAEYATKMAEQAHLRREHDRIEAAGTIDVPCNREGIYAACPLLVNLPSEEQKAEFTAQWDALTARVSALEVVLDQRKALAAELARLEEDERNAARLQARYEALQSAWEDNRTMATEAEAEAETNLARAKDDITRMTHEMDQAKAERGEAGLAEFAWTEAKEALDRADADLTAANSAIRLTYEPDVARARTVVAQVDDALRRMPEAEATWTKAQADAKTWTELTKAFHRDGIPRLVVELGLPLIEDRANQVLGRMPEDMSLKLVTQGITKTGTLTAPTLSVEVSHEGEVTAYDMLSGAQKFRVDLALRLGLGRVLTHRSGATIETLLLDEPDRDLDEEGRQALVDSLNAVADDFGLIGIVTHHPFLIDEWPNVVEVTRTHGESEAVLMPLPEPVS